MHNFTNFVQYFMPRNTETERYNVSSVIFTACKQSLGQGNVFTPVCDSVHGVCLPHCMLGYTPPWQTPPDRHPPWADTPLHRHPLPPLGYYRIWSTSRWYTSYWNAFLFIINNTTIDEISLKTQVCGANKKPPLVHGTTRPDVLQNLILSLVTTVLTNENPANSQILWDLVRFAKIFPFKGRQLCSKIGEQNLRQWTIRTTCSV